MPKTATHRHGAYRATASFGTPITAAETIGVVELAALLHMEPETLRRRRDQLIRNGMPRPIPGLTRVWSRVAIRAWIDRDPGALPGSAQDPVEAARDALEARILDRGQP